MELETRAGEQAPCNDVSEASHGHLYQPYYEMDPRHRGEAWVHMEDPSRSAHMEQGTQGHVQLEATDAEENGGDGAGAEVVHCHVADAILAGDCEAGEAELLDDPADWSGVLEGAGKSCDEVMENLAAAPWIDGTSQLLRLPYHNPRTDWLIDGMHTIGGVVSDIGLGTLLGSRYTDKVQEYEERLGRSPGVFGGKLNQDGLWVLRAALKRASCVPGAGRLLRLVDASKSTKTHTKFLLAGPIGLYLLSCLHEFLPPMIFETLRMLFQACGLLWAKELHVESLPTLQALVIEAVCMVERHLPLCERDIKLHLLTQLVHTIEKYGECNTLEIQAKQLYKAGNQ